MELNIEYNPKNDGYCCVFEHNGKQYYADVCDLDRTILLACSGFGTECMIFAYADGQVTNWTELYCKRGVEVSPEGLRVCIEEFVEQLEDDLKKLM